MSENNDSLLEQINKKYFTEVEHSVPLLQQTLFDLQNEFYKSWKHTVDANTKLYQEFLTDTGYKFPKESKEILSSLGEEATKYRAMYNKMTIQNIQHMKNNAKTWNDNADAFVEANHKIIQYWFSVFSQKRN